MPLPVLGRRAFMAWVGRLALGLTTLLGGVVGYVPRASATHKLSCLARWSFTGTCLNNAMSLCLAPGECDCVDVCNGNLICRCNGYPFPARFVCTCHDKTCCWLRCGGTSPEFTPLGPGAGSGITG